MFVAVTLATAITPSAAVAVVHISERLVPTGVLIARVVIVPVVP